MLLLFYLGGERYAEILFLWPGGRNNLTGNRPGHVVVHHFTAFLIGHSHSQDTSQAAAG